MIADSPVEHPTAVKELGRDDVFGDIKGFFLIISIAVLLPSEEYISSAFALDACEKATVSAHEHEVDAFLRTLAHESRTCSRVTECQYAFDVMQRNSAYLSPVLTDDDVFAVKAEISVGIVDIDRIEKFFHGSSPSPSMELT